MMNVIQKIPQGYIVKSPGGFEPQKHGFKHTVSGWYTRYLVCVDELCQASKRFKPSEEVAEELTNHRSWIARSRGRGVARSYVSPEGYEYMSFQKAGIDWILNHRVTLLADEMGTGKTIQILGAINGGNLQRSLIIVPASLRANWVDEANTWLVGKTVATVDGNVDELPDVNVIVCSYAAISRKPKGGTIYDNKLYRLLIKETWDLVAPDEAHKLKNPSSSRTKTIIGTHGVSQRAKHFVYATGTPVLNHPEELYPLLRYIAPDVFGNLTRFRADWCEVESVKVWRREKRGKKTVSKYRVVNKSVGASCTSRLNALLRAGPNGEGLMIRRLKQDVLKDLPKKRRTIIKLDVPGAVTKVSKKLSKINDDIEESREELKRISIGGEYRDKAKELSDGLKYKMGELATVRKDLGIAKVPAVTAFVKECLGKVGKVILFAHSRLAVEAYIEALKDYGVCYIYGGVSDTHRREAIAEFQTGKARVFVGSIAACGVGLTLTASSTVVFGELDWVPAMVIQAEDRAHRKGQLSAVNVYHCVVDGSLDARVARKIVEKQDLADNILDRR